MNDNDERETIENRIRMAIETLGEYDLETDDIGDIIHEIADGCVPVYTYDILECAMNDNSLATDEPECGPAFDGTPTPVNIIAANIYERITQALWDYQASIDDADDINLKDAEPVGSTWGG